MKDKKHIMIDLSQNIKNSFVIHKCCVRVTLLVLVGLTAGQQAIIQTTGTFKFSIVRIVSIFTAFIATKDTAYL